MNNKNKTIMCYKIVGMTMFIKINRRRIIKIKKTNVLPMTDMEEKENSK